MATQPTNKLEWLYRWTALTLLGLILKFEISTHDQVMKLDTFRQLQEQSNFTQNRRLDDLELSQKKNAGDHKRYEVLFARMAVDKNDRWPKVEDGSD